MEINWYQTHKKNIKIVYYLNMVMGLCETGVQLLCKTMHNTFPCDLVGTKCSMP